MERNVIKSFDDKKNETDYAYDAMGRVLTITGPAPTVGAARPVTTYTYNGEGQVLTMTDSMGHETTYQYDDFGELVQETLPDPDGSGPLTSSVLHWSYDADGNVASYEDGLNHTTTYSYDNLNRKTSVTDPLTGVTHYGYDAAGNLTSLEDPDGNTTTYVYDGLNRVISETNQLNYTRSYVYDLDGNLLQETDRDGRVRNFTYDHLNRQKTEQWMDGSTVLETFNYSYNADGQLTSAAAPDSAYAYSYDGEGRTTSVDNNGTPNVPQVVLSNQFDANSNRTQLSATIGGVADFLNSYSYDALNELTQLYQQGQTGGNAVATKGANLTYNALGQLATIARTNYFGTGPAPDIATSTFSYDNANRLTEIAQTTNGGTAIDAYSWTYDAANRVTSMTTTTDGTATYSYDNSNQVTGASYTTNPGATQPANESYSYDSNGNRTNTGYSTGTNNQLGSDGTFNYTYDHEGNRSTRTRISNDPANDYLATYAWDYRDRLTDVNFYNNSNVLTKHVHYTYDVFDHLIGKQVDDTGGGSYDRAEFYVYDGNDVVLQFDGSGALTERYLNGPSASGVDNVLAEEDVTSLSSPGTVTWPLTDNLGSVRDIVDSTGAVIDHLVYNSFGQIASESNASVHHLQGYAGGIVDADTGMVNEWHRWYDPAVGRWINEDPAGFAAGDANLSRYVGNESTDETDSTGLWVWPWQTDKWEWEDQPLVAMVISLDKMTYGPQYRQARRDYFAWTQNNRKYLPKPMQECLSAMDASGGVGFGLPIGAIRPGGLPGRFLGRPPTRFIQGVTVTDSRTGTIFTGTVDVQATLNRIQSGLRFPHRNDGCVFNNRPLPGRIAPELPLQQPGYYHEYVHPTPGVSGPGPQRIVVGAAGETYYTPDHYNTFIRIR